MSTPDLLHEFKNQLGIILGFAEMLISEAEETDPRRDDYVEIQKAAQRAVELLPRIAGNPPRP